MPTLPPAIFVAPPVVTPALYGLLSVAQFPTETDEHWPIGVQFEEHGAAQAFSADGWSSPPLGQVTNNAGTEQTQTLAFTAAATAGTFDLAGGVNGTGKATLSFNPTTAQVQAAVQSLPGLSGATVTGTDATGPWTITYPAELGPQPALTADSTNLTGGPATVTIATQGVAPVTSTSDPDIPYGQTSTVTVYALFDCSPVGRDVNAARALAKLKLDYAAPRALEKAIWTGKDSAAAVITGQHLADASTTDDLSGGAAVDLVTALGTLEKWLGQNYAGQGVVHADRFAAPTFSRFRQVATVSGHKETELGTRVAFGQGYDGSGIAGAAAPAGQSWLFATPAVMIRQGADVIEPSVDNALQPSANRLIMAAQRQYSVGWETGAAAVLATVGA